MDVQRLLIIRRRILLVFLIACSSTCSADRDVASVSFRGDCTGFGMKIEGAYFDDGAFLVVTTGARFEYTASELEIYQGLGNDLERRLVATLTIDDVGKVEKVEANDDHVLFWSEKLNIGIYGDSTCILAPKVELNISFRGNFKPDYEGRHKGELLLIDEAGGMEIYPQRYEAGYKVKRIELGKKDWVVEYLLNANERVMIAAFPGKHFDWEKSFRTRIIVTHGSMGLGIGNPYGEMPPDHTIKQWSKSFDILVLFFKGLYIRPKGDYKALLSHGPYIVENKPEFRRLMNTAHENGMKVVTYCALFSHYRKFRNFERFYQEVKLVHDEFGIDGVYVDGLTFDYRGSKDCNKILNWEMIRRLREFFGRDGVIILHGTHIPRPHTANPVATAPNIDSYCTATLYGEGVPFDSVDDPYVKYQVRKYGISNTIGMWRPDGPHPSSITYRETIDALLRMNGREGAYGWVPLYDPPGKKGYTWGTGMNKRYLYYLRGFAKVKEAYLKQKNLSDIEE